MQAREASLLRHLFQRSCILVDDFVQTLFPPLASERSLDTLPTRWHNEEGTITSRQNFARCRSRFNHITKVEDSEDIKPECLWKYITWGATAVCRETREGIDIILPVSVSLDKDISPQIVTAIFIQVKNLVTRGLHIRNKLFDTMGPD